MNWIKIKIDDSQIDTTRTAGSHVLGFYKLKIKDQTHWVPMVRYSKKELKKSKKYIDNVLRGECKQGLILQSSIDKKIKGLFAVSQC